MTIIKPYSFLSEDSPSCGTIWRVEETPLAQSLSYLDHPTRLTPETINLQSEAPPFFYPLDATPFLSRQTPVGEANVSYPLNMLTPQSR